MDYKSPSGDPYPAGRRILWVELFYILLMSEKSLTFITNLYIMPTEFTHIAIH